MKKENIIHGDLKPNNYLWDCFNQNDKNVRIFLNDFSCAIRINNNVKTKKVGSNIYISLIQTIGEAEDFVMRLNLYFILYYIY